MYVHVYDSMWNLNGDWVVSLIPRLLPPTKSLASVPGSPPPSVFEERAWGRGYWEPGCEASGWYAGPKLPQQPRSQVQWRTRHHMHTSAELQCLIRITEQAIVRSLLVYCYAKVHLAHWWLCKEKGDLVRVWLLSHNKVTKEHVEKQKLTNKNNAIGNGY